MTSLSVNITTCKLEDLYVDPNYQNALSRKVVDKIKNAFEPEILGYIYVSKRDDGVLYIIDGFARAIALKEMGKKECKVKMFSGLSLRDEAEMYIKCNTMRKKDKTCTIFRASISAEHKDALEVLQIVNKTGYKLSADCIPPNSRLGRRQQERPTIACIAKIERIYHLKDGPEILRLTLESLRKAAIKRHPDNRLGETDTYVISAAARFLRTYKNCEQFSRDHFVDRLARDGFLGIIEAARAARSQNVDTDKAGLHWLWQHYNKSRPNMSRLPHPDDIRDERDEEELPTSKTAKNRKPDAAA